eukprot:GFUD01080686.1.p1 GENE.GFUD01080686.1~~GFUD01080686.1.p1  ORF type:complete len:388 (-),score=98.06 GFUD01080686.1:103-1164(-)
MEALPASIPQWSGPGGNTRPWGGLAGNSRPWAGPSMNTRPWAGPAMNTRPWGRSSMNTQRSEGPQMNTRPRFPGANENQFYGSASLSARGNIEILPAYPSQQSSPGLLPPVQPAALPYQPLQPYQHQPGQAWSRSYSPLPGSGNCYSQCSNRCGSYNTYSGCRPTCSSRCNIRPSCPSKSEGSYMYAGNTLLCGNRAQTLPSRSSQGYGQGYNPGYGQGYNPGYGQQYNPGYGQGNNPGYGQGYNPGYGQQYNPGHGQGFTRYPMQAGGGCSSGGGCSDSYSGYQTLPARGYGMQTSGRSVGCGGGGCGAMAAVTLPAQTGYGQHMGDSRSAVTLPAPREFNEEDDSGVTDEE